jgi:hypothetical protein
MLRLDDAAAAVGVAEEAGAGLHAVPAKPFEMDRPEGPHALGCPRCWPGGPADYHGSGAAVTARAERVRSSPRGVVALVRRSPSASAAVRLPGRNGGEDVSAASGSRIPTAADCMRSGSPRWRGGRTQAPRGGHGRSGPRGRRGSSLTSASLFPRLQVGRVRPRPTCRQPPEHRTRNLTRRRGTASTRSGIMVVETCRPAWRVATVLPKAWVVTQSSGFSGR